MKKAGFVIRIIFFRTCMLLSPSYEFEPFFLTFFLPFPNPSSVCVVYILCDNFQSQHVLCYAYCPPPD